MATSCFLFTYSVDPNENTEQFEKAAEKVRRGIANIKYQDWTKLNTVETAFTGSLRLDAIGMIAKRDQAVEIVKEQIRNVMHDTGAFNDLWVYVALLVDGLGECQEFGI